MERCVSVFVSLCVRYVMFTSHSLQLVLGMSDPSTLETNPGWPLRNFLMLAAQQW